MTELIAAWNNKSHVIYEAIIHENFPKIILLAQRTCVEIHFC